MKMGSQARLRIHAETIQFVIKISETSVMILAKSMDLRPKAKSQESRM